MKKLAIIISRKTRGVWRAHRRCVPSSRLFARARATRVSSRRRAITHVIKFILAFLCCCCCCVSFFHLSQEAVKDTLAASAFVYSLYYTHTHTHQRVGVLAKIILPTAAYILFFIFHFIFVNKHLFTPPIISYKRAKVKSSIWFLSLSTLFAFV